MSRPRKTPILAGCRQCGGPFQPRSKRYVFCCCECYHRWAAQRKRDKRANRPKAPFPGKGPRPIQESRIPLLAERAARGEPLFPLPALELPCE